MRRAALLAVLVAASAHAQVFGGVFGGSAGGGAVGGVCTLDGTTQAVATSYRSTATTGTAFQSDAVLECAYDTGPGARNCIGTNASGEILLGPGSGSGTVLRVFGTYNGLDITTQTLNATNIVSNNAPTLPFHVSDADGFRINSTSVVKGVVRGTATVDVPSINNNACVTQSATVTGAALNDTVWVNANFALPLGVTVAAGNAYVTATNTVEFTVCNHTTAGPLDPASGQYLFRLER